MTPDEAKTMLGFITMPDTQLRFFKALQTRDGSSFDAAHFLEKPWQHATEYAVWHDAGKPSDASEAGWEAFEAVGVSG